MRLSYLFFSYIDFRVRSPVLQNKFGLVLTKYSAPNFAIETLERSHSCRVTKINVFHFSFMYIKVITTKVDENKKRMSKIPTSRSKLTGSASKVSA